MRHYSSISLLSSRIKLSRGSFAAQFVVISSFHNSFFFSERTPMVSSLSLSVYIIPLVSQSVTRGCCCHRTTLAFLVRRSVKVLEVVARSNNHEQPELSFERASESARASATSAHVSPLSATCSQLNSRCRRRSRDCSGRARYTGRAPAAADTIELLLLQRNFNVGSAAGRRLRLLLFHRRRRRRHCRRQMSVVVLVVVHLQAISCHRLLWFET